MIIVARTSRFDGIVSKFRSLLMSVNGFDGVVNVENVLEREENLIHFPFVTREPFIQLFSLQFFNALRTVASETISSNRSSSLVASS